MLAEIRHFIRQRGLLKAEEPVWVAVSGGVDSMVLLHVLRALGHPCSVVHVDHGLRGEESKGDRQLVERFCAQHAIPCRVFEVDPRTKAEAEGLSIQMAARGLRYGCFNQVMTENGWPLATGHHQDDAVETLLLDLLRGPGVHGWASIPPKANDVVRPLLTVDRSAIEAYVTEHRIPFREDASNTDPKYLRNRVRHELIPLMEELRPGAKDVMARSLDLLREMEELSERAVASELAHARHLPDGSVSLDHDVLQRSANPALLLHALLRPRGFHPNDIARIRQAMADHSVGALFRSHAWQACVDREALMVSPAQDPGRIIHIPTNSSSGVEPPFSWSLTERRFEGFPADLHRVLLDPDRLHFPLVLRPWQHGDRMRPAGLGGSKLVSDILIDHKVPMIEKDKTYVLVSGEAIVWLVGLRVAEGCSASPVSKRILEVAHQAN